VPFAFSSCCFGNRKCKQDDLSVELRIVSTSNGQDLVFGPSKQYDKKQIVFYSLDGADTIFHHYGAAANSNPGGDSLLYVYFDYRKYGTVMMRLTNNDVDTLGIKFITVDVSPCCPNYYEVGGITQNNTAVQAITGGVYLLKK